MQLITPRRTGRPPTRAKDHETHALLSLRVEGPIKNLLIDQADAYGMSISEYIATLVTRDVTSQTPA
jgi:hypothetical protein